DTFNRIGGGATRVGPSACHAAKPRPRSPVNAAGSFARRGFVLPLALFMLMVMALLVALLLEGAVQELRIARGDVAGARAQAAAGTALADFFASHPDSALLARPRGFIASGSNTAGADTTRVTLQSLGNGTLRDPPGAFGPGASRAGGGLSFRRSIPGQLLPLAPAIRVMVTGPPFVPSWLERLIHVASQHYSPQEPATAHGTFWP